MISILLATTGRPDMAERAIKSALDTTVGHEVEVCAAVDVDTLTVAKLTALDRERVQVSYAYDYRGCSKAWNDALKMASGDPLVLAADDLVFEPGWLDAALETLAGFEGGWGLVGFNDGHWNEELSTHYLMSRRLVVEVFGGVVAWEHYRHSFNDREANERAQRAGRYAWCEGAHVRHEHWLFGDRPQDDTDARPLAAHAASEQAFLQRQVTGFPNDYDPVVTS